MLPPSQTPGVYAIEVPSGAQTISGVSTSTAGFIGLLVPVSATAQTVNLMDNAGNPIKDAANAQVTQTVKDAQFALPGLPGQAGQYYTQAAPLQPQLVTSWQDFTRKFGAVPFLLQRLPNGTIAGGTNNGKVYKDYFWQTYLLNQYLGQAVYGFFNNGGTRCWVCAIASVSDFAAALEQFKLIDDNIAIMAAPMPPPTFNYTDTTGATVALTGVAANTFHTTVQAKLADYAEGQASCVAVIDCDASLKPSSFSTGVTLPTSTAGYGAYYYPWIAVADPVQGGGASINLPPSGHIAGLYARVDAQRGVFKAPANETLRGATGVEVLVSDSDQSGLNPKGINVIRSFSGAVTVWGARTLASNAAAGGQPEWKYLNVRRTLIYVRESIQQGTRWAVFEPNDMALWARITRSVTDFLTTFWRAGGLFGASPDQAFFVRCDETTNPPDVRAQGMVITQIGLAVVYPSEFVIFQISQGALPTG